MKHGRRKSAARGLMKVPAESEVDARLDQLEALVHRLPGDRLQKTILFLERLAGPQRGWRRELRETARKWFEEMGDIQGSLLAFGSRRRGFKLCADPWSRQRGAAYFLLTEIKDDDRKLARAEEHLRRAVEEGPVRGDE